MKLEIYRTPVRQLAWAFWALLGVVGLHFGLREAVASLYFHGVPINGAFQLLNPLRRIAAGQAGGVDFQFFHGLGVPYLHYPLYRLLGETLQAAEIARHLLSPLLFVASVVVFFAALTRRAIPTLVLTLSAILLVRLLQLQALYEVGHSLLGLRTAMPLVAAGLLFAVRERGWMSGVPMGAALAAALLLGTEQGMAAVAAYVGVQTLRLLRQRGARALAASTAGALGTTAVLAAGALVAMGGLQAVPGALRFHLLTLPRDQFWYFGAPPNEYLWALHQLGEAPFLIPFALAFPVLALVLIMLLRSRTPQEEAWAAGTTMLMAYGLISAVSVLGIWYPTYLAPLSRSVLLSALALGYLVWSRFPRTGSSRKWMLPVRPRLAHAACAGLVVLAALTLYPRTARIARALQAPDQQRVGPAGYLSRDWESYLAEMVPVMDSLRQEAGRPLRVWSTYAGLLEAREELFHPDTDYIIHALGPDARADYVASFQKSAPDLVQTVRPRYSMYEEWLEGSSWEFYRRVLLGYQPVGQTFWSFLWSPRAEPLAEPRLISEHEVGGADHVQLPVPALSDSSTWQILEVEVEYKIDNPWRRLPIIGGLPRHLVHVHGSQNRYPVSLAPYYPRTRFPVVVRKGDQPSLRFATSSLLPRSSLKVSRVRVRGFPQDPAVERLAADWPGKAAL